MAGINMKDIKRRIKSVESTMKITNAMKLVSSSKLRKAKIKFEQVKPFFDEVYRNMISIASRMNFSASTYGCSKAQGKICYIIIGGDRGLAGGYNVSVFKEAVNHMKGKDVVIIPVGKVAIEYFTKNNYKILNSYLNISETVNVEFAYDIADKILHNYKNDLFSEIYFVYTSFISTLNQNPSIKKLLPLRFTDDEVKKVSTIIKVKKSVNYDPSPELVFNLIIPQYIAGVLYGGIIESYVAEQGARRTAMETATDNAKELMGDLNLKYNRARQASITNEITEIISSASANS